MTCRARRPARRHRGFSLVEVLVSILLFTLGLVGLVGLQARATVMSVDADNRNRAALLANEIASAMWLSGSTALPPATLSAWQARVADPAASGLPSGAGAVAVSGNRADITITWRAAVRTADESDSQLTTRVVIR